MNKTIAIVFFSKIKRPKCGGAGKIGSGGAGSIFRERRSSFSLDLLSFGPSIRFGPRSKTVLRGEGYAWTPIWWSSENSKM